MTRERELQDEIEAQLQSAWRAMLANPAGRIVIWSLLEKCHVFQSSYTGGADTYFREGERSIGLKILHDHILPAGTQYLSQMMQENADRLEALEIAFSKDQEADA